MKLNPFPLIQILIPVAVVIAAITFALFWRKARTQAAPTPAAATDKKSWFAVGIALKNEDAPCFKRVYSATLDDRCTIEVTIKQWYRLGLFKSGELRQPNRRYVSFDPDAIADKIIDPVLVPLVEKAVAHIYAIDDEFRKSNPDQFTDESGAVWKRIP